MRETALSTISSAFAPVAIETSAFPESVKAFSLILGSFRISGFEKNRAKASLCPERRSRNDAPNVPRIERRDNIYSV
ncbi:MAG: hypothetical protein A2054_09190 [Deltaproteobacteria bacterium GWA2_55_10]|nr:MAG: hypothetical protein A2054_09190 [Deltaproteobacteria bacterium GWA2_55_10]